MRATTGGASASRPRPLTPRQQKIVKIARRSVTARGPEIQKVARAYKRMNLTPSEQRLANRAAEQHGAHLRKIQGGFTHNLVSDAQKISQGLLDTAGLHGAAHPIRRLENPGGRMEFPLFGPRVPGNLPAKLAHEAAPEDAIAKALEGLKGAPKVRRAQEAGYHAERSRRVQAGAQALAEGTGEEAFRAALREQKGRLPREQFHGLRDLTNEQVDALREHVQHHPNLSFWDKMDVWNAVRNAHLHGDVPTRSEYKLLHKAFGPDVTQQLFSPSGLAKYKHMAIETANIPRSLMASFDVSAPFRQALVAFTRHPVIASKNLKPMIRSLGSENFYKAMMEDIHARPSFQDMERSGLAVTDMEHALGAREEGFQSNYAERILNANIRGHKVGVGAGVRASGRAYTGFLVKTRADMFDLLHERMEEYHGGHVGDKALRQLSGYINSATGRGSLGQFERSAVGLNSILFSPRLIASRLDFLLPWRYANLDPFVRREKVRAAAQLVGTMSAFLWLASQVPGVKVGMDPRSSDFGKIRIGRTRLDIAGGFSQYIRILSQIVTNSQKNPDTGEIQHGKGLDSLVRFGRGKLSPSFSIGADIAGRSDYAGQPITVKGELGQHVTPLVAQDAYDLYRGTHNPFATLAGLGASATGIGVQTYGANTKAAKVYRDHLAEVRAAVQKIGGKRIPPEIAARLRLRLERAQARQHEQDPLVADVNVIAGHHWMTPAEAAHARVWLKTASKRDRASFGQDLRVRFFDRPGEMTLTGFYAWLREHGADIEQFGLGR